MSKEVKKIEKVRLGNWLDELKKAADEKRYVHFETKDGLSRSGRITGLRCSTMIFNGKRQDIIDEFELNGDNMDLIQFRALASIEIE